MRLTDRGRMCVAVAATAVSFLLVCVLAQMLGGVR